MYHFYFDASALVKRYTEERGSHNVAVKLRSTGDTLVLVASDQRLLRAAQNEGLLIFNPEIDPEQTLEAWLDTA